jgi:glycine cleavage system aminomethyltransferase T
LLMGLKAGQGDAFAAGTKVLRGAEEVGHVTSSTFSPRLGQVIAFAYLRRGAWDPGTEVTIDGRPATVSVLPLAV